MPISKWKKWYNTIDNMSNGVEAMSLYTPNNTLINTCHIVMENKNKTETQDMNLYVYVAEKMYLGFIFN